ncbi:hypothetical protein chiPu_0022662 [Chiloscyllium punctatum]|uniref:Uncharacterized protein n=1 Tax=Chiloscyllium punctatum TaxID=137246 RepID=A0A401RJF1_CHIPU|nr:hypothetical protein [Chiloscyllium punctatum]
MEAWQGAVLGIRDICERTREQLQPEISSHPQHPKVPRRQRRHQGNRDPSAERRVLQPLCPLTFPGGLGGDDTELRALRGAIAVSPVCRSAPTPTAEAPGVSEEHSPEPEAPGPVTSRAVSPSGKTQ